MTRTLSAPELAFFEERGYFVPITVVEPNEAEQLRQRYLDFITPEMDRVRTRPLKDQYHIYEQTHLVHQWVFDLVKHPRVLDAVESILGPDIILWSAKWFSKMPGEESVITWHQDEVYWGFDPPAATTAWIALSETMPENGCLRVIPGSNQGDLLPYVESFDDNNVLSRGQEILGVDENQAYDICLQPGEASLHHVRTIHGSNPNRSDVPRIGIVPRFVRPDCVQGGPNPPEGILVRGQDRFGHFRLLEPPGPEATRAAQVQQEESVRRIRENTNWVAEHIAIG